MFSSPRRQAGPALLSLALLAAASAVAAADSITTDRPDFVESSEVVGRGRVQIEGGIAFERHTEGGLSTRTRSTPLLLRVGVSDSLELRLETDGALRSSTAGQRERGFADVSPGLKWQLREGDEAQGTPGVALLAHVDVDTGSAAFRGKGLRPSLRMVAEWELPNDFSVGVMPGLVWDQTAAGKRFGAGILAVTVGKAFTPTWRGFIELAGQQIAARTYGGTVLTLDAGVAWLLSSSLQLDLAVSRGLNHDTPDLQWGLGLSIRF